MTVLPRAATPLVRPEDDVPTIGDEVRTAIDDVLERVPLSLGSLQMRENPPLTKSRTKAPAS